MNYKELITLFERDFFTGAFSESAIIADLEATESMDRLSTLGSSGRQTYMLSEKRNIYFQDFDYALEKIDEAIDEYQWDNEFISRCERCKNQINLLSDIVRNF